MSIFFISSHNLQFLFLSILRHITFMYRYSHSNYLQPSAIIYLCPLQAPHIDCGASDATLASPCPSLPGLSSATGSRSRRTAGDREIHNSDRWKTCHPISAELEWEGCGGTRWRSAPCLRRTGS